MSARRAPVNAAGFKAWIKRVRRGGRGLLNRLLTRLTGTTQAQRKPLAEGTRRILVVRLNKRLGNIIFLTPMLRTLAASLPEARIDVVIQDARQTPLLANLPGVGRIWVQEKSPTAGLRLLRRLRAQRYDLAIDPSGNSTSNRLIVALSRAPQRLGFIGNEQWLKLTHAAARPNSRHQAIQGVELLQAAVSGIHWQTFNRVSVFPDDAARAAAAQHWREAFAPAVSDTPVVAFFTQATGRKQLDTQWWSDFRQLFAQRWPQARLLQICPPGVAPASDTASVCIAELDVLAATIGRAQAFVAADSGPMHLAAAVGVPVVGLFKATNPQTYAPLGRDCVCLSGDRLVPARAVAALEPMLATQTAPGAA